MSKPPNPEENDPRYPVAMLQTAFEMKNKADGNFQDLLKGIIDGLEIQPREFEEYLEAYRDSLRATCKKRGYT